MPEVLAGESDDKVGKERVISLVFGLMGVVQGLAFTKLAEKVSNAFDSSEFSFINLSKIVYFAVGFFIVVRVFQTYTSGVVSYAQRKMKMWDLYAIFIAGLLQYWVFDAFSSCGVVDSPKLFSRVMWLSLLAVILHALVIVNKKTQDNERKIQKINISLAAGIMICCIMANWIENEYTSVFLAATICLILFLNTWNSLNNTDFGTLSK